MDSSNGHRPDKAADVAASLVRENGDEPVFPGVVVIRKPSDEPGKESIQVIPINNIDELSIPTLLRIAAMIREQQFGLGVS